MGEGEGGKHKALQQQLLPVAPSLVTGEVVSKRLSKGGYEVTGGSDAIIGNCHPT